jgi:uncharacterized membrane protein YhaH (DUF805 family)
MKDYLKAFAKIFNYRDEATISEFWNFFVINIIVNVMIRLLVRKFSIPELYHNIYIVIATLTLLSIGFRRLKNAGYSGWLFLIPIANLFLATYPEKKTV